MNLENYACDRVAIADKILKLERCQSRGHFEVNITGKLTPIELLRPNFTASLAFSPPDTRDRVASHSRETIWHGVHRFGFNKPIKLAFQLYLLCLVEIRLLQPHAITTTQRSHKLYENAGDYPRSYLAACKQKVLRIDQWKRRLWSRHPVRQTSLRQAQEDWCEIQTFRQTLD